jgi:hypothetical protein
MLLRKKNSKKQRGGRCSEWNGEGMRYIRKGMVSKLQKYQQTAADKRTH